MTVTGDQLRAYLEQREVWVPKDASRQYLEAAVVRHHLHAQAKPVDLGGCFGFWQHEDMACLTCSAQGACFETSVGMGREEYHRRVERHRARVKT